MKTYNRALDYTALAIKAARSGNVEMAGKMLTAAAREPSAKAAMAFLEASNRRAYLATASAAASAKTKLKAAKLKAEAEFDEELEASDMDDLNEYPLLAAGEDEEFMDDYALDAESVDDLEDDEELEAADCDEEEEAPAKSMEAALRAMRARAKVRAAARTVRATAKPIKRVRR